MNRYSFGKYALVPLIAWFFYWAVLFEMYLLHKPIQDAFMASYQNWVAMTVLIGLVGVFSYKERKANAKTIAMETKAMDDNPFTLPKKTKKPEKDSFRYFMRSSRDAYSEKIESAFDSVYRSRIHKRIFFKLKRITFGLLSLLYLGLAFMSVSNPLFFVLFLITAYAFVENLLLAKHYQFIKRRVKEDEENQT